MRENSQDIVSQSHGTQVARKSLKKIRMLKRLCNLGGRGYLRDHKFFRQRDSELARRAGRRFRNESMFDILLSGTSATLLIQTARKIYIGWVGDSLVAMQGSEKNIQQHFTKSVDLFMTYPPHKPDLQTEKVRIYSKRGEIRESPLDGKSRIYIRGRM